MARNPTPYKVECRDVIGGFEIIASFNCDVAAFAYARRCAKEKLPGATYRVTKRNIMLRLY